MNYLTLGCDCSPASALRNLNLRDFALPFDWIVSDIYMFEKCFEENFARFHTNLKYNNSKTRLIDDYGFQYPHDYPLENDKLNINNIGEGIYGEGNGKIICSNYMDYYNIVFDKYKRRIERFLNIINDEKPIIILCRFSTADVLKLKEIILKNYKKENIYFINSNNRKFENDRIINIFTEKNNIWNEENLWEKYIKYMKSKIMREISNSNILQKKNTEERL